MSSPADTVPETDPALPIARWYQEAQQSFVALVASLSPTELATPAPCTPAWTVRDLLSHVSGVTRDILDQHMAAAGSAAWAAAQVERGKASSVDELLTRWDGEIDQAAAGCQMFDQPMPAIDCWVHEHDLRQAIGRPGNRDHELLDATLVQFAGVPLGRAVRVELTDGDPIDLAGEGTPLVLRQVSRFELMRSRLGRRSRAQVAAYDWSEPPSDEVLDRWFLMGPNEHDIVE